MYKRQEYVCDTVFIRYLEKNTWKREWFKEAVYMPFENRKIPVDVYKRQLLKPLPETERSSLEAKVPSVKRRTSCVYADLLLLSAELGSMQAA